MKSAPRLCIVAYAVNGSGLGHLTRVLAVLRWVRRLAKLAGYKLDAHVLTSSEACGLAFEEGFAAWKIPSKTAVRATEIDKESYLRLARQWVWHSLGLINPDILLVDTFPAGSFGELWHALDGPARKVLLKRAMKPEFAALPAVQGVLPFYDKIIVPCETGAEEGVWEDFLAERVRRVGPIMLRGRAELRSREEARRRWGVPPNKLAVYVSAGGGGDAMAQRALAVLAETLGAAADVYVIIGAGPLYRGAPVRGANVTWATGFHALQDFAGLDAAFSAAGFNSFHELLHAGVPTAFFAQEKIADEQARRVRVAHAAGCALALEAVEGVPTADAVRSCLAQLRLTEVRKSLSIKAQEFVPENAAREAAYEILATALPRRVLADAYEAGTEEFFLELAATGATVDDFLRLARGWPLVEDWSAAERRTALVEFFAHRPAPLSAATAARLARTFARLFVAPTDEEEAVTLLDTARQMLSALALFDDERNAHALLQTLGQETAGVAASSAPEYAARWAAWLTDIYQRGGSLSTARARLAPGA